VGENDQSKPRRDRHIWRRVILGLAACVALVIIFHRPILLAVVRQIAIRYAGKQNLKLDFSLEGEPLSYLTVRNLHAVPTGPSAIESVDVDSVYVDYSLPGLVRYGFSHLLQDLEMRGAQVVLNPAKAPPPKPHRTQKLQLPTAFPERIRLTDATLVIRETPNDFVIRHADLDLNPRAPGELRIAKLQLPSGDSWSKLSAQVSYKDRNFNLRNLVPGDQTQIALLQIDASHIDSKALGIKLECVLGGGQLSASIDLNEAESSLKVKVNADAGKIAAGSLTEFLFLPENYVSGEIDRFALVGAGVLDAPRTWSGTMSVRVTDVHLQGVNFDKVVAEVSAGQGKVTLQSADVVQNQNELHLQGTIDLPAKVEDLGRTPTNLQVSGKLLDLEQLTAGSPLGLTGSIEFNGKLDIVDTNLQAKFGVTGAAIGFSDGKIDNLNATIRASKNLAGTDIKKPWFADLRTAMEFTLADIRYQNYVVDSVEGTINGSDDMLGFDQLNLRRNQNELSIHGHYRLPEHLGDVLSQPVELDVVANAPQVGEFWAADSPDKISGSLQMTSHIERKQAQTNGRVSISGSNIKMRDLIVKQLSVQGSIVNDVLHLNEFSATLNDTDFAKAAGTFDLQAPHHYSGRLSAHIASLSVLEPLLREFGNDKQLTGSLKLDWEGNGQLGTALSKAVALAKASPSPHAQSASQQAGARSVSPSPGAKSVLQPPSVQSASRSPGVPSAPKPFGLPPGKNSGNLNLSLENGRYGNLKGLQANINASYSPEGLNVPTISFTTDNMDFQAIAQTKDDRLEIDKIQLDQGQAKFVSGYISIPFVWSNLGTNAPVIPPSGKVSATVQVENLDLKKLAENFGIKSSISGVLNARLDASGTVANLNAQLAAQGQDLRSEQWPKMEPASFELSSQVAQNQLTASGKLQQPQIQPLEIGASMPFDLPKFIEARGLPDDTPISAKARLPRSSVNFVRQLVPEIEQLDGSLALDIDVRGTIGNPVFSGAADMKVNVARFTDSTLPALGNFNAELAFAQNALSLRRFGGDLAGGSLMASGRITFPKLTQPTLDLRLRANSALVARNDTLTIRADADIGITGPLASATVTGNVALTDSHILKNIELIPIGLPGRPPPQPPSATPELSVTTPPLRDWKFNVAIKTKNPVEIRGNLATGGATVDLKLTGTGLHPGLQGVVQMQNVEATLPFSRLDVSQGLLTFDPSDPMNPKISLQGRSVIRDYTVRVYVYGTVESPQAIFTSEPPLPQEEIISLIATGATRQELSGTNVLAGRAAMLLLQELYRKIVKKGQPTQSNTYFNRLDLQLGTVDPRTGEQQATARFKIDDHLVLIGDVGVRGDFRGRLKYLIRFR
jgi:TamB, inner membrane protein subunit of TAM complex